ncbi:Rfm1p Ecym_6246 [Eremothecium cymbalariae DBVPG|uniref:Uncharacterized protein n=1 Tax=Eremothecium cymbalariae (strain CBS 270.75 / DBVPG 7215 / KCTC 17166 / NRRL Y-17582) TaxID=931890 RepID=G8JVE9_ERECY|nr:hypothetical protein Ecym_6246 [Eremothecium cymbalariae DBVPG\
MKTIRSEANAALNEVCAGIYNNNSSLVAGGEKTENLNEERAYNIKGYNGAGRIKQRRLELLKRAVEVAEMVEPMEFESYRDYFIIKTFKRGRSESGRVNVSILKRLKCGVYYERINTKLPNGNENRVGNSFGNMHDSSTDDSEYKPPITRRSSRRQSEETRKPLSPALSATDETGADDEHSSPGAQIPTNPIRAEISVESIIPNNNSDTNVRRSMRLTSKEKDRLEKEFSQQPKDRNALDAAVVTGLYEVIIPKFKNPVRRSDWVLPTRQRYIPDKHQPVKHVPEQVKINELVKNNRIKTILSRFEGGLAGVRTLKTSL